MTEPLTDVQAALDAVISVYPVREMTIRETDLPDAYFLTFEDAIEEAAGRVLSSIDADTWQKFEQDEAYDTVAIGETRIAHLGTCGVILCHDWEDERQAYILFGYNFSIGRLYAEIDGGTFGSIQGFRWYIPFANNR